MKKRLLKVMAGLSCAIFIIPLLITHIVVYIINGRLIIDEIASWLNKPK